MRSQEGPLLANDSQHAGGGTCQRFAAGRLPTSGTLAWRKIVLIRGGVVRGHQMAGATCLVSSSDRIHPGCLRWGNPWRGFTAVAAVPLASPVAAWQGSRRSARR